MGAVLFYPSKPTPSISPSVAAASSAEAPPTPPRRAVMGQHSDLFDCSIALGVGPFHQLPERGILSLKAGHDECRCGWLGGGLNWPILSGTGRLRLAKDPDHFGWIDPLIACQA